MRALSKTGLTYLLFRVSHMHADNNDLPASLGALLSEEDRANVNTVLGYYDSLSGLGIVTGFHMALNYAFLRHFLTECKELP